MKHHAGIKAVVHAVAWVLGVILAGIGFVLLIRLIEG